MGSVNTSLFELERKSGGLVYPNSGVSSCNQSVYSTKINVAAAQRSDRTLEVYVFIVGGGAVLSCISNIRCRVYIVSSGRAQEIGDDIIASPNVQGYPGVSRFSFSGVQLASGGIMMCDVEFLHEIAGEMVRESVVINAV